MDDDWLGDSAWQEVAVFTGGCTCDHEPEEHGWGACYVELPGGATCPCGAGWEE